MPDPSGPYSGQAWPEQAETALGLTFGAVIAGKYRVERVIGKGGMGVVVAASQLALDRTVAIKLIRAECAEEPMAVERLLREAKAAASITSEHVARVLDVGTLENGVPFIVMEYLDGSDLQTLLERDGPLPAAEAVDFLLQACEAIAEAHRNGIVHRDIKPANVFVARMPGGVPCVKVVDFGISKLIGIESLEPLTLPSSVVGSLYHMAPEQMRGLPVDARTDVWALGLLLFEMLTGRKPFREDAWPAVCAQILSEAAPVLVLPSEGIEQELGAVIERCLRRTPRDRFGNVAELAVALAPFGSRSARVSLERIVRLATSTGSLSADALVGSVASSGQSRSGRNLALDLTRPVPVRGLGADTPRGTSPAPRQVRLSTPTPMAAPPSAPPRALPRWRVVRAVMALGVIGAALLLLWPRPSMPPEAELRAPLRPLAPPPHPLAEAPADPLEPGASADTVAGVAAPPSAASDPVRAPSGAAGAGAGGATVRAEAAPAVTASTPAAASAPKAPTPRRPGAAPGELERAAEPAEAVAEPSSGSAQPSEVVSPDAPASVPSRPAPKAPNAWDLSDIRFQDEARP
jgi:serine/threonine-protein kinase